MAALTPAARGGAVDVVTPWPPDGAADGSVTRHAGRLDAWLRPGGPAVVLHLLIDPGVTADIPSHRSIRIHRPAAGPRPADPRRGTPGRLRDPGGLRDPGDHDVGPLDRWRRTHDLTPRLEGEFLTVVGRRWCPDPRHLAIAVAAMRGGGTAWYVASTDAGVTTPDTWRTDAAVFRRSLWVDLNGVDDDADDPGPDFFRRAAATGRRGVFGTRVTLRSTDGSPGRSASSDPPVARRPPGPATFSDERFGGHLRGRGWHVDGLRCDVLLPFRDHLPMVRRAADSVLDQRGVDVRLHLIDDDSRGDVGSLWRRYRDDGRVRVYRNRTNLGQFLSFNHVARRCESDFLVTQDGDDVSLPGRLRASLTIARLSGADLVGGATILRGDEPLRRPLSMLRSADRRGRTADYRYSFDPRTDETRYFLENPTLVHRAAFFRAINGFGDFGGPAENRTSVDTEYMLRAHAAGAVIAASSRVMIRYTVHRDSAVHDPQTRMGSPTRRWCQAELYRRVDRLRRGRVSAAGLGAGFGRRDVTVPLSATG